MKANEDIYNIFKENIRSFGLENAAKILGVDQLYLSSLLKYENINYDNKRLSYAIKLKEYAKNQRRKAQVTLVR